MLKAFESTFAIIEEYFFIAVRYGVMIMECIGLVIILITAFRCIRGMTGKKRNNYRIVLAKGISLALEFKLGGEVLKTVIAQEFKELGLIACLIAIRASLTFLLHWEIKNEKKEELEDTEYLLVRTEEYERLKANEQPEIAEQRAE